MTKRILNVEVRNQKFSFVMDLNPLHSCDEFIDRHFANGVSYEPEVAHVLMRVLRPGDCAVDVGANIGFFTLFMSAAVGPTGYVYAYEPGSNNLPTLRKNIALNNFANIEVNEKPLWNKSEPVTFWLNPDSAGSNCLWDPGLWHENKRAQVAPNFSTVDATTLDASVHKKVRLIKIDTEGAEQRILEGAMTILTHDHPPFIVTELNPFGSRQFGCNNQTLRDFMGQFGYDIFLLHPDGTLPSMVPRDTEITHLYGTVVSNALFSTLSDISQAWPKVPYE